VLVANARQLRLIYGSDRKSDRVDAETLARLGRLDPALLKPIHHRGPEAQADLAQLRARDALVRTRTLLINHVRGAVKAWGARLPASSAPAFATTAAAGVPRELRPALGPLLELVGPSASHSRPPTSRCCFPKSTSTCPFPFYRQAGAPGHLWG
jgi:transposase